jgi:hypothetical protein
VNFLGFHSSVIEDYHVLGYDVVDSILKQGIAFIFKDQRPMNSEGEAEYHTFI